MSKFGPRFASPMVKISTSEPFTGIIGKCVDFFDKNDNIVSGLFVGLSRVDAFPIFSINLPLNSGISLANLRMVGNKIEHTWLISALEDHILIFSNDEGDRMCGLINVLCELGYIEDEPRGDHAMFEKLKELGYSKSDIIDDIRYRTIMRELNLKMILI